MVGILYWFRSFAGMFIFVSGFGLALAMLALSDYYQSPFLLLFAAGGVVLGFIGREAEKRAKRQFVVDRASAGK